MPGQASASIPLSALSPPLDQSLEHFIRRLAIVDLATAPAVQHRGHGDGHLPEPIRQLLLDQPQQSPTIVSFLGSPSGRDSTTPQSSSSPQPRPLLARSTGTGRQPGRLSRSRTSDSVRSAPGRSALWTTTTSATSSSPAFCHWSSSPASG